MIKKCNWCGNNYEDNSSMQYCSNKCEKEHHATKTPISFDSIIKSIKVLFIVLGFLCFSLGWYLVYLEEYLIGFILIIVGSTVASIAREGFWKWWKENG
jgi:hypothetical protein